MERADEATRPGERLILRGGSFERIRHVRRCICLVGKAARLPRVEAPCGTSSRAEVQRRQRVDLSCMRLRGDGTENSLRLVDAGAVVGLHAPQVRFDDALRCDLFLENRLLYLL